MFPITYLINSIFDDILIKILMIDYNNCIIRIRVDKEAKLITVY